MIGPSSSHEDMLTGHVVRAGLIAGVALPKVFILRLTLL